MFRRHIGMATDAGVGAVGGQLEFGDVHEEGNRPAGGIGLEQRVVTVAIEAIAVLHPGAYRKNGEHKQEKATRKLHPLNFGRRADADSAWIGENLPLIGPSRTLLPERHQPEF
jgi:hypothetical protein